MVVTNELISGLAHDILISNKIFDEEKSDYKFLSTLSFS